MWQPITRDGHSFGEGVSTRNSLLAKTSQYRTCGAPDVAKSHQPVSAAKFFPTADFSPLGGNRDQTGRFRSLLALICCGFSLATTSLVLAQETHPIEVAATQSEIAETGGNRLTAAQLDEIILAAFAESADGFSVDEVLLSNVRRTRFLACVRKTAVDAEEREINLALLRLRKTGKITARATRRGRPAKDIYRPAAEIGARITADIRGASTDEMIADPELRSLLLEEAGRVVNDVQAYDVLKHVLGLRKARQLKPELVLRVAQWKREILVWSLETVSKDMSLIPKQPGVYLFRTSDGYLYIGEAADLRRRLSEHLQGDGTSPLSAYLIQRSPAGLTLEIHAFAPDSPAKKVTMRRAYESELIRSREPLLNIRP